MSSSNLPFKKSSFECIWRIEVQHRLKNKNAPNCGTFGHGTKHLKEINYRNLKISLGHQSCLVVSNLLQSILFFSKILIALPLEVIFVKIPSLYNESSPPSNDQDRDIHRCSTATAKTLEALSPTPRWSPSDSHHFTTNPRHSRGAEWKYACASTPSQPVRYCPHDSANSGSTSFRQTTPSCPEQNGTDI